MIPLLYFQVPPNTKTNYTYLPPSLLITIHSMVFANAKIMIHQYPQRDEKLEIKDDR